jgi:hypothetical protein
MFIFSKKLTGANSVCYHWRIELDGFHIGDAHFSISPVYQELSASLYRVASMPESVIKTMMKEFKNLANNHLLDIDEDYEPLRLIRVTYYDDINNPIFY